MKVPGAPLPVGRAAQIPHPDDPHPSDLYDIVENTSAIPLPEALAGDRVPPCPECASPLTADAIVCIVCGFNRKLGRKVQAVSSFMPGVSSLVDTSHLPPLRKGLKQDTPTELKPQPTWLYLALPIALVVVGLALTPLGAAASPDGWKEIGTVAASAYLGVLAELVFVLLAIFSVSAMGGVSFDEPLWRVGLKLCAVAILPGAVAPIVHHGIGDIEGSIVGNMTQIAMYFGLFVALFRQSLTDTTLCVFAVFIIRTFVTYILWRIEGARTGSEF